jgi:DNA-binding CsgD family transcriptional regulator
VEVMTIARIAQVLDADSPDRPGSAFGGSSWGTSLTERELTVAVAAARGLPTREIANRLFVSPRTVEHHLMRVYQKFHISSRSQLCALVIDHLMAERAAS